MPSKNKDIFRYMQLRDYFMEEMRSEPDGTSAIRLARLLMHPNRRGLWGHDCVLPNFGRKQKGSNAQEREKMCYKLLFINLYNSCRMINYRLINSKCVIYSGYYIKVLDTH